MNEDAMPPMLKEMHNDAKTWSIKLGFRGVLSDDFFIKWASVLNVRAKIIKDLKISIFCGISFATMFILVSLMYPSGFFEDSTKIFSLIFAGICAFSIIGNMRVIAQWKKHDTEMIDEWGEKKMNTIETQLKG